MATASIKEQVYQELARITQAMANPKRMELIDALSQKDYSVEELSKEIRMSVASTSQHLQVLKSVKMVQARRNGNFIVYSIGDDSVLRLVSAVKELGSRKIAEIDKLISDFNADKKSLESITLEELQARSRKEKIILIDVRPEEEYQSGHIPRAISIPLDRLKKRMKELPRNRTIIAYCRGPLCVMSAEAVKMLREKKYRALRMEAGYVEWKLNQS